MKILILNGHTAINIYIELKHIPFFILERLHVILQDSFREITIFKHVKSQGMSVNVFLHLPIRARCQVL